MEKPRACAARAPPPATLHDKPISQRRPLGRREGIGAVPRDLVLYLYAGSLPGGLQEIQKEAGAASQQAETVTSKPAGAPTIE